MRVLVNAALIAPGLALLSPDRVNGQAALDNADDAPACRAQLKGGQLTTTIEFRSGYRVEGPWHVTTSHPVSLHNGEAGVMLGAELDQIVEVDGVSGTRTATTLPKRIAVTFQAQTHAELVHKAATVFCFSVVKARAEAGEVDPPARTLSKSIRAAD
jgi:hypothetical protein